MSRSFYNTHTLKNNLRIIHTPSKSEIACCGFRVNTGSRDENEGEFGMAHFVEHMLFKGTSKRKAHRIVNRIENVGGYLNAYTTKEETVVYALFLKEYYQRAIELLCDVIFNSVFPSKHISMEQAVISEEISSYLDSPDERIYDDFENILFANHDIGHDILGSDNSISKFDQQQIQNFVKRQYKPSQMVFFITGDIPFSKIVRLSDKYLSLYSDTPCQIRKRSAPQQINPADMTVIEKGTSQAHIIIGSRAHDIYNDKRLALLLLNNILGGDSINCRLNNELREKKGLVYSVESNVISYTDTGVFAVSFACDHRYVDKCSNMVRKELQKLIDMPLTPHQLHIAKQQWKGQIGILSDNMENNTLVTAKSFLHHNYVLSIDHLFSKIDNITTLDIQSVANDIFEGNRIIELRYL